MAIYTTQLAYLHRVEFPESSSNAALEKWWGGIFTSGSDGVLKTSFISLSTSVMT